MEAGPLEPRGSGQSAKLVPNTNYWGKKPNLASVTFNFITDTAAEQQDYKSGQILAFYPQAQPGGETLKGTPGTYFDAVTGLSYEGLWFNVDQGAAERQGGPPGPRLRHRPRLPSSTSCSPPSSPASSPSRASTPRPTASVYTTPFAKYHLDLKHGQPR